MFQEQNGGNPPRGLDKAEYTLSVMNSRDRNLIWGIPIAGNPLKSEARREAKAMTIMERPLWVSVAN